MVIAERLDEYGKGAWIAATVLGFWLFWPIGMAVLIFLAISGRIRAWRCQRMGQWYAPDGAAHGGPWSGPWSGQANGPAAGRGFASGCGWGRRARWGAPSGNAAFDEYKQETLRRLEEEQREFREYLERLRRAKDKEEFDHFMADRRRPAAPPAPPEQPEAA